MSPALKYVCFSVLVLFALVLTAVCGELACESFVHASCGRIDRAERMRRHVAAVVARVFSAGSGGFTISSFTRGDDGFAATPLSATSLASVSLRV